ncbi:SDR family oxidoreductase [Streptomyces sp. NPDC058459]|uniref:SDR family oxidoreductase n=1 Tax=Streptomyces sp. NPDC058459 TaxID=3346508 RepID=UPI0036561FBF
MKIVVAGATGTLGKHVADAVRTAGHEAVAISRASGSDLVTGSGLTETLRGADAVIDASATSSTSARKSVAFFTTVTRNLLAAEREAGVPHHVAISIIGAARINANYYAGKAAQEEILRSYSGGWSMLRTSQFHEFVRQILTAGKVGPVQVVPKMLSQPVAAREVAGELVTLATGRPQGLVPDFAGPRRELMADLVRRYLATTGVSRPVLQVPLPGAFGRGMRDGTLLPEPGTRAGRQTFGAWLADQAG